MKQLAVCITCLMLVLLSCSMTDSYSGTAESGNAIVVGMVVNESGTPVENVQVSLIPETYNSLIQGALPDSLIDTTDASGLYRISVADSGYYNVSAMHRAEGAGLLVRNIYLQPNTTVIRDVTLNALEKLILSVPENSDPTTGYVYIQGTTEYVKITAGSNQVVFDSIPVGFLPPIYYVNTDDISDTILLAETDAIEITVGTITFHGTLPQWAYRKKAYINTTPTGANTVTDVVDFPLLIRLNSSNFSFTNAQGNGQDIRLTKQNNSNLPYEIEKWDSAGMLAEIWVKMDTIYANNNTQYINLYWGNNTAVDSSIPSQVFDTTDGFCGVWHFAPADTFSDATANDNDGSNNGSTGEAGIIGDIRTFDGIDDDDYISIGTSPSLHPTTTMTLQAWIKPSAPPARWEGIIGNFYDNNTWESGYSFAFNDNQWRFCIVTDTMSPQDWDDNPGSGAVPQDVWSHLTGTYDGSTIKFYLNGILVASEQKGGLIDWEHLPLGCRIGMYYDSNEAFEFTGSLDEIRVLKTACSDDWIKLCYETQKAGSNVVELK